MIAKIDQTKIKWGQTTTNKQNIKQKAHSKTKNRTLQPIPKLI